MTRGDRLLVLVIALFVVASVPISAVALSSRGSMATVSSPVGTSTMSLARDGRYLVEGRHGCVTLEVSGGEVRCVAADCPDQTCVHMGTARGGRPIVCAPNAVVVTVGSAPEGSLDAVSR